MIKSYDYQLTHFMMSAPNIRHLPVDSGVEIAFIGRSNSGKSSLLNTLANQKNLAKTSKNPGCTEFLNLFEVEPGIRLVDLPGYGYAKVPNVLKYKWQYILYEYLQTRDNLKGLVILIDIRHPMKNFDQKMVQWAINANTPILVLLTKSDKLSLCARKTRLDQMRKVVLTFMNDIQVETFSSLKKQGLNELRKKLDNWFCRFSYHKNGKIV